MKRAATRLAFFAALAGSTLFACQLIVGVKNDPGVALLPDRPPIPDGGPSRDDPCEHARPPPMPTVNDGNEEMELVFAARKVALGQRVGGNDGGEAIGFDLDGICSCENAPLDAAAPRTLCKVPTGTSLCSAGSPSDDRFGRDLGAIQALAPLSTAFDTSGSVNGQFERGDRGLLVTVQNYNGKANDPLVRVSFALSAGLIAKGSCDASTPLDDAGDKVQRYTPCWEGSDAWSVVQENARFVDGWVNNFELVVEDAKGSTKAFVGIGSIALELAGPAFQATLVPPTAGRPWVLDGVLAGRVDADALLATLGVLSDPVDKSGRLCEHPLTYGLAQSNLCPARDIPFNTDDPERTCNGIAVAVGVRFEGAKKGTFVTPQPPPVFECAAGQLLRCDMSADAGVDARDL